MGIGRVRKESTNSTVSESFEKFVVRRWAVRKWGFIEFPVTSMYESSHRSLDEKTDGIWDRVIDDKRSDLEMFSYLDRLISLIFTKIRKCSSHISLFKLDKLICHSGSIDRSIASELFHHVVDSSDVVDMSVSDTHSYYFLSPTVSNIWK